eukprot:88038_1
MQQEASTSSGKLSIQITAVEQLTSSISVIHEWIIIISCLIGALIYEIEIFEPNQQVIPTQQHIPDYLSYPNKPSTISTLKLILYSAMPCILVVAINGIILKQHDPNFQFKIFMHNFHLMLRTMLFASMATWFVSNIMKYSIGRPRPNFEQFHQVKPVDSRLSFPSTHASISFSLLFQLSMYLYMVHVHVLRVMINRVIIHYNPNAWDSRNPYAYYCHWLFYKLRSVPLLSLIIVGSPTYLATYISCTRITDYYHFYSDVLAGIMIGILFAVASFYHYSQYLYHYPAQRMEAILSGSIQTNDIAIQIDENNIKNDSRVI